MYKLKIRGKHGFHSDRCFDHLDDCKYHAQTRYELSSVHAEIVSEGRLLAWSTFGESTWHDGRYAAMFCPIVTENGRVTTIF